MVEFQFMSGLNTIGGNIIDIRSDNGRVIFDYGEVLDPEVGQLPDLSHSTENTAIFISHLHIDHIGSLGFVPKEIPVYMSKESYTLYHLLRDIGEEAPIEATVYPVAYQEKVEIGDIQVVAKENDHDIRGASAFFVETPDVKLVYSGDLRLTGHHPEYVEKWLKEAATIKPDILLLEGTAFSFDEERKDVSEDELFTYWETVLRKNTDEIIFINTYIRDTVRLLHLIKRAKKYHRTAVLEPKFAYLLKEAENYKDVFVLKELDEEEEFKDQWIDLATIQKSPSDFVLQNSFKHRFFMEKFEQGIYGHSNGEPLGDYDPKYEKLMATINNNHFKFEDLNAGGHATKEDLVKIAQAVDAKVTIPWHSFKPEALLKALAHAGLSAVLPERGVIYSRNKLKSGEMI